MEKHVTSLRSICETMDSGGNIGKKPSYCACGKVIEDPIHYKTEEIKNKKLTTNNLGLIVIKND